MYSVYTLASLSEDSLLIDQKRKGITNSRSMGEYILGLAVHQRIGEAIKILRKWKSNTKQLYRTYIVLA